MENLDARRNCLLSLLIGGNSIETFLEELERVLGLPVVFSDLNFKVYSPSAPEAIKRPEWQEAIQKGFCGYGFILDILNINNLKSAPDGPEPYVIEDDVASYQSTLVSPLLINRKYAGALLCFFEADCEPPELRELLLLGNQVLTEMILKTPKYKYIRGYINESILLDLIEGNNEDNPELHDWILNSDLRDKENFCVFVAEKSNVSGLENQTGDALREDVYHLFPKSYALFYRTRLVVLAVDVEPSIKSQMIEGLSGLARRYQVQVGISGRFNGIEHFRHHYLQAAGTLEVGRKRSPQALCYDFSDYKYLYFLAGVHGHEDVDFQDYVHPAFGQLRSYDDKNQTELFKTLCTYAKNNGNYKAVFEGLHIHRNTLNYRMDRICQLTGLDLSVPELIFELQFSLLVMDYLSNVR